MKNESSILEYESRLAKVLEFINKNLDKDLSLQKLSEAACFSQFHFHRIFTSLIGETPQDFVKRLRLEKAANLLASNKLTPITEIAFNCGFTSCTAFARAFKEHFNCSASEWRKNFFDQKLISKNCKIKSKNGKEFISDESYFSYVTNFKINIGKNIMPVEVKKISRMTIAYAVHTEGYNEKIKAAYDKLFKWAHPRGLLNQSAKVIGLSFDNPEVTPIDKCRYYAAISIPEGTEVAKGLGKMEIPEIECACYRFKGKNEAIPKAYDEICKNWLPQSGFQPADFPSIEFYYNDPQNDPEGMFDMEICVPVKPL